MGVVVFAVLVALLFAWAGWNLLVGLIDLVRRLRKGEGPAIQIILSSALAKAIILMLVASGVALMLAF